MLNEKRWLICSFCGSGNLHGGACRECGSVTCREVTEEERKEIRRKRKKARKMQCYLRCLSCEWSSDAGTKVVCMRVSCAYHRTK